MQIFQSFENLNGPHSVGEETLGLYPFASKKTEMYNAGKSELGRLGLVENGPPCIEPRGIISPNTPNIQKPRRRIPGQSVVFILWLKRLRFTVGIK